MSCIAFNKDGRAYSGNSLGNLITWKENYISEIKTKLHKDVIDTIKLSASFVITGGRDMKVHVLDILDLKSLFTIDLNTNEFNSVCGKPRAIDVNETTKQIIIGTYGCEIYKVEYKNKVVMDVKMITSGHY